MAKTKDDLFDPPVVDVKEPPRGTVTVDDLNEPPITLNEVAAAMPESGKTLTGDVIGGVVGAAIGTRAPTLPAPSQTSQKKYDALLAKQTTAEAIADKKSKALNFQEVLKTANVDTLMDELLNSQRQLETIGKQLEAAKLEQAKFLPETINKAVDPASSGGRWNEKVVGGLSPAGASSTESARLYNQTKALPPEIANRFNVTNVTNKAGQGMLIPNTIDPNYMSPAHRAAAAKVAALEAAYAEAQSNAAKSKLKYDALGAPGAVSAGEREAGRKLATAQDAVTRAATTAEQFVPEKMNMLQKAGYAINKIPGLNVLGGTLSGAQLMEGAQQYQKGDKTAGAMGMLGGAGGALMMAPNPYAKIAGAAMSIPPLAYEAYKYFSQPKTKPPQE